MGNIPQLRDHTTIKHSEATEHRDGEKDGFSRKTQLNSNGRENREELAIAEHEAVSALAAELSSLGISYAESVNLWVSLKSKPAMLLYGSSGELSDRLSSAISRTFVGDNSWQSQRFQGHPWWSEKSNNPGRLMMVQQQFTSIQLRSFLTEAAEYKSSNKLFFAHLIGISRAELREYFVYLPLQVQTLGGILELPFDVSSDPTPYPNNVYLIATINLDVELSHESDIFDVCTLMYTGDLSSIKQDPTISEHVSPSSIQKILISRRHFTLDGSLETISMLDLSTFQLGAIKEVLTLLEMHKFPAPTGMVKDACLFYANAWDALGQGLFDANASANVHLVGELWLQQSVVPRLLTISLDNRSLRNDFLSLLTHHYPRSGAQLIRFLDRICM